MRFLPLCHLSNLLAHLPTRVIGVFFVHPLPPPLPSTNQPQHAMPPPPCHSHKSRERRSRPAGSPPWVGSASVCVCAVVGGIQWGKLLSGTGLAGAPEVALIGLHVGGRFA